MTDPSHEPQGRAGCPQPAGPRRGEDTAPYPLARFIAPMHDSGIVKALHEPQKVAQASCLFGADRLEACPTLQPAPRFMAPTHVQSLEVLALHGWGETTSSPDFYPLEGQGSTESRHTVHRPNACAKRKETLHEAERAPAA